MKTQNMTAPLYKVPQSMHGLLRSAEQAAALIPEGAILAASGYTSAGDPKATLSALAARGAAGDIRSIDLITAAQLSPPIEDALANVGLLRRRAPFTVSPAVRELANRQELRYVEAAMGKMPRLFASGAFGTPDVAIVEALALDDDGRLIPTASVGMTQLICRQAKSIIIELNEAQPALLAGLHDVYEDDPAHCGRSLVSPSQRIGRPWVQADPGKIIAIVRSDQLDYLSPAPVPTEIEQAICRNLMEFLADAFPGHTLPPVQTGIGSLSQAILAAFDGSGYRDLTFFCGALQAGMVELLASGKAAQLSGGSISTDARTLELLQAIGPELSERLVLRSMEVCNGSAAISSVGLLALNTGIEMDLFGNVNSSHIAGRQVVNGIGGGATFAANAALSVMLMPSVRKGGQISCFVPVTPHVDVIHHDVDVVVSEYGVADLRGRDDVECARLLIERCAHPDYRPGLAQALEQALSAGGHHPILLEHAFDWQARLQRTGSML